MKLSSSGYPQSCTSESNPRHSISCERLTYRPLIQHPMVLMSNLNQSTLHGHHPLSSAGNYLIPYTFKLCHDFHKNSKNSLSSLVTGGHTIIISIELSRLLTFNEIMNRRSWVHCPCVRSWIPTLGRNGRPVVLGFLNGGLISIGS